MPFDGLSCRSRRGVTTRFPQIADQVRCSSGFTYALGGRLRALSSALTPHRRDRTASKLEAPSGLTSLSLSLLALLERETGSGMLPRRHTLGQRFGVHVQTMGKAYRALEQAGLIETSVLGNPADPTRVVLVRRTGVTLTEASR